MESLRMREHSQCHESKMYQVRAIWKTGGTPVSLRWDGKGGSGAGAQRVMSACLGKLGGALW